LSASSAGNIIIYAQSYVISEEPVIKINVSRDNDVASGMSSDAILGILFFLLAIGCCSGISLYIKKKREENSKPVYTETEKRYLEIAKLRK